MTAAVVGSGLQSVTFLVNGRRVLSDYRAPFGVKLHLKKRSVVRAHVAAVFDRLVTVDRVVRACT